MSSNWLTVTVAVLLYHRSQYVITFATIDWSFIVRVPPNREVALESTDMVVVLYEA